MEVFVARHAILDKNLSLFGYELLFRSCQANRADVTDDSATTLQLLANTLLSSGLSTLACDKRVFVNFGQELLTSDWTSLLPPESVVVEILETVKPNAQVLSSCLKLRESGYLLALDDVTAAIQSKRKLVDVVDFIKVDFRATTRQEQRRLASSLRSSHRKLLAEKVETHEDFVWARDSGYDYFQGFFFARPALMRGEHIPSEKVSALRLLKEVGHPEPDFTRVENIVKCDVSLTYKLFRYVNSALFARRQEISSVRQALLVLGEIGIRRWISLAAMPTLASDGAQELMVHALVRARFCELLAANAQLSIEHSDAFLTGLFSLLDAFVNKPLAEILPELNLRAHINEALLGPGTGSRLATIYRTALAYERGEWDKFDELLVSLPVPKHVIAQFYFDAVSWSREMLNLVGPESPQQSAKSVASGASGKDLLALHTKISGAQPEIPVSAAGSSARESVLTL